MSGILAALRWLVKAKAHDRCEHGGLAQVGQEATFHIDHFEPVSADGPTMAENLALACTS